MTIPNKEDGKRNKTVTHTHIYIYIYMISLEVTF